MFFLSPFTPPTFLSTYSVAVTIAGSLVMWVVHPEALVDDSQDSEAHKLVKAQLQFGVTKCYV